MAIIQCPECNTEVSDRAAACVKCGFPIKEMVKCPDCGTYAIERRAACAKCGCPLEVGSSGVGGCMVALTGIGAAAAVSTFEPVFEVAKAGSSALGSLDVGSTVDTVKQVGSIVKKVGSIINMFTGDDDVDFDVGDAEDE